MKDSINTAMNLIASPPPPSYQLDRAWSDKFLPAIKHIVGPYLLEPAPFELDARESTDLIVLRARDLRIAARVRRHGYAEKYRFEFTLRAQRDSGQVTELTKIVNGFGDWFFYAHADASEATFALWWLIDLHAFRAHMIRDAYRSEGNKVKWEKKSNGDGTHFFAFDIRSFPDDGVTPPLIVGSSQPFVQAAMSL